jgi:DNA invertase Pin-like site-specific DNA recombinase
MTAHSSAVIYCRYSPRPGSDDSSLESQFTVCRQYCFNRALLILKAPDGSPFYSDEAASGKTVDGRFGFQAALARAIKDQAVLVVYQLSRAFRSGRDAHNTLYDLQTNGATFAAVADGLAADTPTGKLVFSLLATVAEMERSIISQRTSDAMKTHQTNGRKMNNNPPYGYKINTDGRQHPCRACRNLADDKRARCVACGGDGMLPAELVEDPDEQTALALMIELSRSRVKPVAIAKALAKAGYKPRGEKWYTNTVSRILERRGVIVRKPSKRRGPRRLEQVRTTN